MLETVARFAVRRRRLVLVMTPLAFLVVGLLGGGVVTRLGSGGWHAPTDESTRATVTVNREFAAGPANLVLLVRTPRGVDAPEAVAAGSRLTDEVRRETGVSGVASYWSARQANEPAPLDLRALDQRSGLVVARVLGDDQVVRERIRELRDRYSGPRDGVTVSVGGQPAAELELVEQSERDLRRSELAATPVVIAVLLLVFGGVVAAALPFAVGFCSVLGTVGILAALSTFTDVSVFSLNLTTALGFGLAVDYGLFLVTRFREELDNGRATEEAVVAAVTTAGRTVLFSALTVAMSLSSLLVFPLYYLRSFAYAGIAVVGLAAGAAVVVLPALLAVLGRRVDALPLRALMRRRSQRSGGAHRRNPVGRRVGAAEDIGRVPTGTGFWHNLAVGVMRRPLPVAASIIVVLVVLGAPFLNATFALPDDRLLPAQSESHQVADTLRREFPQAAPGAAFVVAPDVARLASRSSELTAYATALSRVPGVVRVDTLVGSFADGALVAAGTARNARFESRDGSATWLSLSTDVTSYSPAGERLVRSVRSLDAPFPVLLGGDAAHLVDTKATLARGLPKALLVIAGSTLIVLFLFTGSVVIPIKAVVLNLLSLTATFGVMVWGFQEGHLRGLVGDFQLTQTLELTTPILMFCIAFGLSMDYELFLLSRIKEEYDRTGDNAAAVALGLERTGRLITSAAAVVVIVLAALATSGLTMLKMLGVGLAIAVLVDATLVRGALVPAFMRLAGRANWWAPQPLRVFHARFGLTEAPPVAETSES